MTTFARITERNMQREISQMETAIHSMTRRAVAHDYTRTGIYHITLHVADGLGQPLGDVVGDVTAPDGTPNAPRVALTEAGQMVEHELLHSIHEHYPMVDIQDYIIMPEHLHFLAEVQAMIISRNGKRLPLGQVIAGFKKGCNRRYWEIIGDAGGETAAHTINAAAHTAPSGFPAGKRQPAGYKVPSNGSSGRQPLFAEGYCDVMPIDTAQLATQRAYIKGNPRSRLQRMSNRALLSVSRGAIHTALTPSALRGYLQRECPPTLATADALAGIESRLLIAPTNDSGQTAANSAPSGSPAGTGSFITCDSFGNRALLTEHRCLPVICHRKDAAHFNEQKARCLEEAARGAVLVSACISPKEREIINESINHGFPVITIHDNGFTERFHPSAERQELCATGRLLLVSPWVYQYRGKNEQVTVPFCKAMNCVVQALCKTKCNWWKEAVSCDFPAGTKTGKRNNKTQDI